MSGRCFLILSSPDSISKKLKNADHEDFSLPA
jgi:hypothetical protein